MSVEDLSTKDSVYKMQISKANELGNALLSGIIAEGIAENKKNIKISGGLSNLRDLIENYKNEVEKIKYCLTSCFLTSLIQILFHLDRFKSDVVMTLSM